MKWKDDIQYLKGVGPKRVEKLKKLDITTVGDLLSTFPRGYVDYSDPVPIATAPYDVAVAVKAEVLKIEPERRISGGRRMQSVMCMDDTAALKLVFFNNPWAVQKLELGEEYVFYGKVWGGFSQREMTAPTFLKVGTKAAMVPIYPLTAGLKSYELEKPVSAALQVLEDIPEPIPEDILQKYMLPSRKKALRMIHKPKDQTEVQEAKRRFIFEELFFLQLGMLLLKDEKGKETGAKMHASSLAPFFDALPFTPTNAQHRSISDICGDMQKNSPMNRLLQGDVGSGKTLVAAAGIYMAAQNGYQSVLMAPTEILAVQHAETLYSMLGKLGIEVVLLTGSVKGKQRTTALKAIADGTAQLVVGTHAVLSEPVEFSNLGLAITDEQHRFGVNQRSKLAKKAHHPHLLVMSATPIPRTLALLMFADLDISVLDELPPGRTPIKTRMVSADKRRDMFGFLGSEIAKGRQVYIVCPRISEEESEESELQAAKEYAEDIARPMLPNAKVGLLHGRMKAAEKSMVMQEFKAGNVDVLVSTTVVEVGVDVPNANVMVIEDAERYGLSALHQLRGRVGRGKWESWCFLVSDHSGKAVKDRLSYLCHNSDGFKVAKYDLETRGPGDFFGSRQHGLPTLRIADLASDTRELHAAQKEALKLLESDPKLDKEENKELANAVQNLFEKNTVLN